MPSLEAEDLPQEPQKLDPYQTLELDKTATSSQIKSSYRRLALQHHPDKASSDISPEAATEKFQSIAYAYAILSEPRRKARYDATGRTEESFHPSADDDDVDEGFNWSDFYRSQFEEVISEDSIEAFRKEYQGSEEEREHVLKAYEQGKGDLDVVYEEVMLSSVGNDDVRFRQIINDAIKEGEVEAYTKFTKETAKKRKLRAQKGQSEAKEAEELAEELGLKDKLKKAGKGKKGGDEDGLKALIMQRQQGRAEGFLANLEAKYAPKGKKGKKAQEVLDEPSEEAFSKNRKRGKETEANGRSSKRTKA